jgi:glycosyl transferase family 25
MKIIKIITLLLLAVILIYPVGYYVLPDATLQENRTKSSVEGVGCYIVNLDRSTERYQQILPLVKSLNLPYERISAVDGSKLTEEDLQKVVDFKMYAQYMGHMPKNGTIGCSLSHIELWKRFLASNFKYALVFEDDVTFEPDALNQSVIGALKQDKLWDICSFEVYHRGLPVKVRDITKDTHLFYYLLKVTHTGCYMISRQAAQKLLAKALPIKIPVDHYFTRGWELGLTFAGVEPRVVHQKEGHSEIERSARVKNDSVTASRVKLLYEVQTSLIYFWYNLKQYVQYKICSIIG